MPSVTYLLSDLGGGTGHHLFAILRARTADSWTAEILSEAENTARVESPVPLETLPATRFGRYPVAQLERFQFLRRRLAESPPDILHTYFFWSIIYGRLLKASGVVPHLVENREDLGFNWGRHEYGLLKLTRRYPDRVVCVSDAVRRHVLEHERLAPSRVEVIRNGVALAAPAAADVRASVRAELSIPPSSPIVGMVANFNRPVKGATYFVDALERVARSVPDVRFLLIGLGDNEEELRRRAAASGFGDQLLFTGFRADIGRLYDAMDVSALTSLSEGLSITLLESMSHGVPVVATDVGGNPEVVLDGETGFLVPPRDPDALAAQIVRLLEDGDLRRRFSRRAREVVSASFSLGSVAANYGNLYGEVVGAKPVSSRGPNDGNSAT